MSKDAYIDIRDLCIFAEQWLSSDGEADFNHDGIVNCHDFKLISEKWHQIVELPKTVGEQMEILPITEGISDNWQVAGSAGLSQNGEFQKSAVLAVDYSVQAGDVSFDYSLEPDHLIAERLRFWLKGDGSGNIVRVYCYHAPSNSWILLTEINQDFYDWRHIVVPAQNPIYRYYSSITAFRFEVSGTGSGELQFSSMELVEPKLVGAPIVEKEMPNNIFNTWGGASRSDIETSLQLGTTLHLAPINFISDNSVSERTSYARSVVKTVTEAGKIAGIQFYNHPGSWVATHPEYLPKNQAGQLHDDAGAFTSPWHPEARQLFYEHIKDCLNDLASNNRLQYVEAVELCPGLECEMSFEWGNVWAFDDNALEAYRSYLRDLYNNDIVLLNSDWASNYSDFETINPPSQWFPDREHWVFTDFYRYSLLEYYVYLSKAVREVCEPKYWLALPHTIPTYPMRFYSARYPIFYAENLKRLGILDFAQVSALDWHHKEDVEFLKSKGVRVIGEVDVEPTTERLEYVFSQSKRYGMDGVFVGTLEPQIDGTALSAMGLLCQSLIDDYLAPEIPVTVIEDFDDVGDWEVYSGSNAISGAVSVDEIKIRDGNSGKFDFELSAAVGFDYVDYVKKIAPANFQNKMIVFEANFPDSTAAMFQLRLESESGGFVEYSFDSENGLWQSYVLNIAEDFADYGTNPDLTKIDTIRIRANGDVSNIHESGSFNFDSIGYRD